MISADITVSPDPALLRHTHDSSGTSVAVVRFDARAERLAFESRVRVSHTVLAPFDLEDGGAITALEPFAYHRDDALELARLIARRHPDAGETQAWAQSFVARSGSTRVSSLLSEMTQAIRGDFAYRLRLEGAPQTPAETLALRTGSCRDFAMLMIEGARSLGLAARFVSGYIYSSTPRVGRTGGGHTHAWAQVYAPGCGWVDFDPTNGIVGNRDLIRVACVADPRLAIPLHGAWAGRRADFLGMDVEVDLHVEGNAVAQPRAGWRVARGA